MPLELEELTDLSAPLRWGQQDPKSVPPDGRHYARRYPNMLMPIPRDADPRLPLWRAHIDETKLALYSWPKCDLRDLAEDRIPFSAHSPLSLEFDKLIDMHFVEPISAFPPVSITMRAQLVNKTKTEKRFTVNGSVQKQCMRVASYPMPSILKILDFVASFEYRCKLDLKHAYHNLEVHPEDRRFTITIGAGRAVQWRKCVQGFASTGHFFQWAMETILGPSIVFVIAAVYLDDLIVVGHTAAACLANFDTIMRILNDFNFRVAFAKCQFTPCSSIAFLGCQLDGLQVSPGPKVADALGKILPFYSQPTPKTQQKHLYSFLGLCAYLNNHKLGLKQALQPLYDIVAKSPFTFSEQHRLCFDHCKSMLLTLDPYWLPDPAYPIYRVTDASGGTTGDGMLPSSGHWAAVLGQRHNCSAATTPMSFNEDFHVLQIAGGAFNARQANWSVIEKEYFAIFQGFVKFDQFIRGRPVTLLTDSKVLLHAFRSTNQKVRRWYSFVQGFQFDVQHVTSEENALCDALTRCVSLAVPIPAQPRNTLPPPMATKRRPRAPVAAAVVDDVPAPSLLQSGDVESNPGPRVTELADNFIQVESSFSSVDDSDMPPLGENSDDDAPLVAPVVEPPAPRRRRNTTTPPQIAPPAGEAAPRNRRPTRSPVHFTSSSSPADLAPASSSPAARAPASGASAPPPPVSPFQTFDLACPDTDALPDSMIAASLLTALSTTLSFSAITSPLSPDDVHHSHPDNIRDSIVYFMCNNASACFDIFDGIPMRDVFRRDYILPAVPNTLTVAEGELRVFCWREYCQLLLLPTTAADPIMLKAAALLFRAQIILIKGDNFCVLNPDTSTRRVFLRIFPNSAADWMCLAIDSPPHNPLRSHSVTIPNSELFFRSGPPQDAPLPQGQSHSRLLHSFHCGHSGHPGAEATVTALRAAGHEWRGMTRDVRNFVRACPTCSLARIQHTASLASAIPDLRLTDRPLSRYHIDHVDFHRCDHTGFKAVCVCVDEVTGYTFLQGSRFKSAFEVALCLLDLSALLGTPEFIHTDGGKEFDSDVIRQFQSISGLKQSFGIPLAPNTRGIAERNVAMSIRFVRSICLDFGRHNAWGLFLPLVMRALNCLPRRSLGGCSPQSFLFSSLHDHDPDVFPVAYAPLPVADIQPPLLNSGAPSANFAQRALYAQQLLVNHVAIYRDRLLQASMARDSRKQPADIQIGQQVLIDWAGDAAKRPKLKSLPKLRGPYTVTAVHNNTLHLCHAQVPPPPYQPATLVWSRHAHVYDCELDFDRSPSDPSATNVPLASASFGIDCIISHQLRQDLPRSITDAPGHSTHDVRNQRYEVRYHYSSAPHFVQFALRTYDDIAHTSALDNYVIGNPGLHSHRPIRFMPAVWDPRVTGQRRSIQASQISERDLGGSDSDDAQ
jgi:hypothetical protein